MKQSLNLKVSQHLSLTPQLKQSLRLLKLSSLDLEHEIQQTLDANPLLERLENETSPSAEAELSYSLRSNENLQPITKIANSSIVVEPSDRLAPEQNLEGSWQEVFESRRTNRESSAVIASDEFTQYAYKQESLVEHLSWQVQMTALTDKDKLIAETLLHCLDDDGYLGIENAEICQLFSPSLLVEEDEVNAVLSLIKTLDPIGVGARNLPERLLILLNQLPNTSTGLAEAKLIVSKHLELLASHNFVKLRQELGVNGTTLATSLDLITQLNPRIASLFATDNQNYVVPDILVNKVNERWLAQLNTDNHNKLRTNLAYANLLKSDLDKHDSDYIQHNLLQAKLFIKGLMSRYDTLLLVGQAIVERQQAFFESGEEQMRPMVLQDIAHQLEMHESTISRATAGKYLLCARGVFELKYFFPSALTTADGDGSSSTAIRCLIRKMIDRESKIKPLSDSKIVKELEYQGHIVARRTVAKYREGLQIEPSSRRKALQ